MQRQDAMKFALLTLIALATSSAVGQTFYVYGGRVAIGPRTMDRGVRSVFDLSYSRMRATNRRARLVLRRLNPTTTYRCDLLGQMRLVGLEPGTSAVRSEYRVSQVARCRPARARDMIAANRGYRP